LVRLGKVSIGVKTFGVCGYGLALAALALVVFGAYDSYMHTTLSTLDLYIRKLSYANACLCEQ